MEKLQAAIEKARQQRSTQAPAVPAGVDGSEQDVAAAREALWQAIAPLEQDRKDRLESRRVVSLDGGRKSSSFDMLRTRIKQMMDANGWKRLVVTSPDAGCDKTTVAANLALSFGRQVDLNTILMDLDMRRPSLKTLLQRPGANGPEFGADAVLTGQVDFADQARRIGNNVAISLNVGPVNNSSELLQSPRSAKTLDEIEAVYGPSLMIFDMPPLLQSDDTSGFLNKTDCALIVAEAGASTVEQIDRSERMLSEQTNVLGVVLNKTRFKSDVYASYDYYSK